MSDYVWKLRGNPQESIVKTISEAFKLPRGLAKVLAARGLDNPKKVQDYFYPSLDQLHDPFLLNDVDKAVFRILQALKKKELICIHGDYDVDGTTSTSMLIEFLRGLDASVIYHIPDRFQEGYGIVTETVKHIKELGVSLIITVDVGITSVDAINYAKEIGIDTIICDHHEPGPDLPEAYAILDPLLPDSHYPFKHLAACGVVFKLIQAISKTLNQEEEAFKYLDYVAIASAADMVPLVDENRILSYFGLKLLNEKPRPGIKGLMYCTNLKPGNLTTFNIIYSLAPLINAAGRLGSASRSVEMMIQNDEIAAFQMAQQLEQDNRLRRFYDEKTFEEAIPMAEKFLATKERRSLILHKNDWHAGVIGIVASRLVDKYHLPTILLTTMYNLAKGSARSILNFDIHSALKECAHLLIEFGGHKHAAGLSLELDKLDKFIECFDNVAHKHITKEMLTPELLIDAEISLSELSPKFFQFLQKFAPFGFENNKPIFLAKGIFSKNGLKMFGANNFKFRAVQPINFNGGNIFFEIDAVGQNLGEKIKYINSNKPFSLVFILEEITTGVQTQYQLRVKDILPDS